MTPRDHHYLFSHVHLRNLSLLDPAEVLSELTAPTADGFLLFLWGQVEDIAENAVEAAGLNVAVVEEIGSGTLIVLEMPKPEAAGESTHVALFVGPAGPRYFVFDRAASDPAQANLAELERDDTRISYGLHPANLDSLLAGLVAQVGLQNPDSVRPGPTSVAPMALASTVPAFSAAPTPPPTAAMMAASIPPMPIAPPAQTRKRPSKAWPMLAVGALLLGPPLSCCLGASALAYRPGLDADATIEVTSELLIEEDRELVRFNIEGPSSVARHQLSGPGFIDGYGAESSCRTNFGTGNAVCTIYLDVVVDSSLTYTVVTRGPGPEIFGVHLGDDRRFEQTVEITRTPGLRWSDTARTTVLNGFPGQLRLTSDGHLRLEGAPPGTSLTVDRSTSSDPVPSVQLSMSALVNRAGVGAILAPSGEGTRVSVPSVFVRRADGNTVSGTIELDASVLAPGLIERLALLGDAELGLATGTATVWIEDGRLRQVVGTPQILSDIGRVIRTSNREVRSGRCGPYSYFGLYGGSRIPRMRWESTVDVYNRVEQRRQSRRRFRGDRATCPYSIQQGTTVVHGPRIGGESDAYARDYLVFDAS